MSVTSSFFGVTAAGKPVRRFTISDEAGMSAVVSDYGAILVSLYVPCSDGSVRDVVLGYDTLAEYERGGFFGATVGRHANRISGAAFSLEGVGYRLADNDNGCNLHSDFRLGFHKQLWDAEILPDGVRFSRLSPDGECGFPGNLNISVTYTLDQDHGLHICYEGVSDQTTLINLTNHSFFNLSGHDTGSVLRHNVQLLCSRFLEIREGRLPTGRILPVEGTPFDFRSMRRIADAIDLADPQLRFAAGYDHCYVTDAGGQLRKAALVEAPDASLRMEVSTDLPGVQFYTANFLPVQSGKSGAVYGPHSALCLETEYFPDSIHHPQFPQAVFAAGEHYHAETIYRFI